MVKTKLTSKQIFCPVQVRVRLLRLQFVVKHQKLFELIVPLLVEIHASECIKTQQTTF